MRAIAIWSIEVLKDGAIDDYLIYLEKPSINSVLDYLFDYLRNHQSEYSGSHGIGELMQKLFAKNICQIATTKGELTILSKPILALTNA